MSIRLRVAKFNLKVGSQRTTKIENLVVLVISLVVLLGCHCFNSFTKKSGSQEDNHASIFGCPHQFCGRRGQMLI